MSALSDAATDLDTKIDNLATSIATFEAAASAVTDAEFAASHNGIRPNSPALARIQHFHRSVGRHTGAIRTYVGAMSGIEKVAGEDAAAIEHTLASVFPA